MTPEQFVYWLQGFVEMHEGDNISPRQFQVIKDHLQLVFKKETLNRDTNQQLSETLKKLMRPTVQTDSTNPPKVWTDKGFEWPNKRIMPGLGDHDLVITC